VSKTFYIEVDAFEASTKIVEEFEARGER